MKEKKLDRAIKRPARAGPGSTDEPIAKRRKPGVEEITTVRVGDGINVPVGSRPAEPRPAAVTIRMTVTSGFYVRSLIHEYAYPLFLG